MTQSDIERAFKGKARPDIEHYAVASRRVGSDKKWPNLEPQLLLARKRYNSGLYTLATGKYNGWETIYCIPLMHPVKVENPIDVVSE